MDLVGGIILKYFQNLLHSEDLCSRVKDGQSLIPPREGHSSHSFPVSLEWGNEIQATGNRASRTWTGKAVAREGNREQAGEKKLYTWRNTCEGHSPEGHPPKRLTFSHYRTLPLRHTFTTPTWLQSNGWKSWCRLSEEEHLGKPKVNREDKNKDTKGI